LGNRHLGNGLAAVNAHVIAYVGIFVDDGIFYLATVANTHYWLVAFLAFRQSALTFDNYRCPLHSSSL
jgi:hypothetical protein